MWQTLGQDTIIRWLQHSLQTGRLSHAYLLVGPRHIGKGTLALDLARAVNCQGPQPPCGECRPCQRIAAGKHADVLTLRREEGHVEIGIHQVREVQRPASLKPVEGRCRVFIIDGAEDLSAEASNCLLKTLEEPSPQALFLLLASRETELLPTVRSRCQRLALRPLPREQVEQELRRRGVEPPRAALLARLARGRLGWALAALPEAADTWSRRRLALERLPRLARASYSERFSYAAQLAGLFSQRRHQAVEELELWQEWWRDLLLIKGGASSFITNWDYQEQLQQQAQEYSLGTMAGFLQELRRTRQFLESNANPWLALENLMLRLPYPEGRD